MQHLLQSDETTQLLALEELNQTLSLGQSGEVRASSLVPAMIRLVETAENPELTLLSLRALNQILDLEPRAAALALHEGVAPLLCTRLLQLSDLDIAEQCVKCLSIIAQNYPTEVLMAGGLKACAAFFDFFPVHVQRRAADTCVALLLLPSTSHLPTGSGSSATKPTPHEISERVHDALPSLFALFESSDDKVLKAACTVFGKISSMFVVLPSMVLPSTSRSNNTPVVFDVAPTRLSATTLKALRALQAAPPLLLSGAMNNSIPSVNVVKLAQSVPPTIDYYARISDSFVTVESCTKLVNVLNRSKKASLDADSVSNMLSCLSRMAQRASMRAVPVILNAPHIVDLLADRLGPTGILNADEQLTCALKLVQSLLPPVPRSSLYATMNDPHAYDATVEPFSGSNSTSLLVRTSSSTGASSQNNDGDDVVMTTHDPASSNNDMWSCTKCTFLNPRSQGSCEICGYVSPAIEQRSAAVLQSTSPTRTITPPPPTSCQETFQRYPHLLELIVNELMPGLTQVAACAASPEHCTRALSCLASILMVAPRSLLNKIGVMYGPGGKHYAGVVSSGLNSDSAHVVSSALRVSLMELWRSPFPSSIRGLAREGIPQLVRGLGTRFQMDNSSSGDVARVLALRKRASLWLEKYETAAAAEGLDRITNDTVHVTLMEVANALLSGGAGAHVTDDDHGTSPFPNDPAPKKAKMVSHDSMASSSPPINPFTAPLIALRQALFDGVTVHELSQAGIPQAMSTCVSSPSSSSTFTDALRTVFHADASRALVRALQELLDSESSRFPIRRHGKSPRDAIKAVKTPLRVVLKPTPHTLKILQALDGTSESTSFDASVMVDPLASVSELKSFLWTRLKRKMTELKPSGGNSSTTTQGGRSGSSQQQQQQQTPSTPSPSSIQAGDPVYDGPLLAGMVITRGRDWKWEDQDGGPGRTGVVCDVKNWNGHPNSCIRVRWDFNGSTNVYRFNVENSFDLTLAPRLPSHPITKSGMTSVGMVEQDPAWRSTVLTTRGSVIDAMDHFHHWYKAVVRVHIAATTPTAGKSGIAMVRVAFDGWNARFDEWIPLQSRRLAPAGSRIGVFAQAVDDAAPEYLMEDRIAMKCQTTSTQAFRELPEDTRVSQKRTGMTVFAGVGVYVTVHGEDGVKSWKGSVVQLGLPIGGRHHRTSSSVSDDHDNENETKTEERGETITTTTGGHDANEGLPNVHALVRLKHEISEEVMSPSLRSGDLEEEDDDDEGGAGEEDEDDGEDGAHVVWLPIDSEEFVVYVPKQQVVGRAVSSSSSSTVPPAGPALTTSSSSSSTIFAMADVLGHEAWLPILIKEQPEWVFGGEDALSLPPLTTTRTDVSGLYCPSLNDLKLIGSVVRDVPEIFDGQAVVAVASQQQQQPVNQPLSLITLSQMSSSQSGGVGGIGPTEDDDEEDNAMAIIPPPPPLRMMPVLGEISNGGGGAGVDPPTKEPRLDSETPSRSMFYSARPPLLVRSYSGLEVLEQPSSSSSSSRSGTTGVVVQQPPRQQSPQVLFDDADLVAAVTAAHHHHADGSPSTTPCHLLCGTSEDDDRTCTYRALLTIHGAFGLVPNTEEAILTGQITTVQYTLDFSSPLWMAQIGDGGELHEESGMVSMLDGQMFTAESNFPTLTCRGIELKSPGAWYYEMMVQDPGLCQIGWMDSLGTLDDANGRGCGDDLHGWAYDGKRCLKWHLRSTSWGSPWKSGDVVGCAVVLEDNNHASLYFSLNGSWAPPMGKCFEHISFVGYLKPALSFNKTFKGRLMLGGPPDSGAGPLTYPPPWPNITISALAATIKPLWTQVNHVTKKQASTTTTTTTAPEPALSVPRPAPMADFDPPLAAKLLRVMAELELLGSSRAGELVNRRLTNKLNWQYQDALCVCTNTIPSWCRVLTRDFSFLFPFETRMSIFVKSAFGVSRSLHGFLTNTSSNGEGMIPAPLSLADFTSPSGGSSSTVLASLLRGMESVGVHGISNQLKKQKVAVPRGKALEAAIILMRKCAPDKSVLFVEFQEETGHGLGPTLEFYATVCREVQRMDLGLWRGNGRVVLGSNYVTPPMPMPPPPTYMPGTKHGLFPAVTVSVDHTIENHGKSYFLFLGRFVAKALMDERLLDLDLSEAFLDLVLGRSTLGVGTLDRLRNGVDPEVGKHLTYLVNLVDEYDEIVATSGNGGARAKEISCLIDDLNLDWTIPGAPSGTIVKGWKEEEGIVNISNIRKYCDGMADFLVGTGISNAVEYFKLGFEQVFSLRSLSVFSSSEVRLLLAGDDGKSWTYEEIVANTTLRDYQPTSPQIVWLFQVMSAFNGEARRAFLTFCTGSPRLCVAGWAGLNPKMSVVRKEPNKSGQHPDSMLPSCSTCLFVFKLPAYSSKEKLVERLKVAMTDGQAFFSMD